MKVKVRRAGLDLYPRDGYFTGLTAGTEPCRSRYAYMLHIMQTYKTRRHKPARQYASQQHEPSRRSHLQQTYAELISKKPSILG